MSNRKVTDNKSGGQVKRGDICDQRMIQDILGDFNEIDPEKEILQNTAVTNAYLGDVRLFHTFQRHGWEHPYEYAGLCAQDEGGNMHPAASKRIFIISQYHADTEDEIKFHERFAESIARMVVEEYGDIPIAPHLYFTRFMQDSGLQREFGIEAGHILMGDCDRAVIATIDGYISPGMRADIEHATVTLGLETTVVSFTKQQAMEFINETENSKYEERNRAKHR